MHTVYEVWSKDREAARYERLGAFPDMETAQSLPVFAGASGWRQVDNRLITEDDRFAFVSIEEAPDTTEDRIVLALNLIREFHGIAGEHHQRWVTDQLVRILTGDDYEAFVAEYRAGEDGTDTYEWDEGIAP